MRLDGARGDGFPCFFAQLLHVVPFPFPVLPPPCVLPNWSSPSCAREQPGPIPCRAELLGLVLWLLWVPGSALEEQSPGTHVPVSAAPLPQLLSLHLTQLNIKASKHFSSSAQHCLPNYPPAGLSGSASCFPGCWQPLACVPASLQGKPCSPNLPSQLSLQLLLPWGYLRCPRAILACLSLFKRTGGAVCSSKAVL